MKQIATEETVRNAYAQLKEEGSEITVANIRKIIGGGSNCTILNILHTIEEENADATIYSNDPDENQLIKDNGITLLAELYRKCKHRADELARAQYRNLAKIDQEMWDQIKRIDEINEKAQYRTEAAEAKMNEALTKTEVVIVKNKELERDLQQRDDEIKSLKQQLQEQRTLTNNMLQKLMQRLDTLK